MSFNEPESTDVDFGQARDLVFARQTRQMSCPPNVPKNTRPPSTSAEFITPSLTCSAPYSM
jgi:hypothetical protein